MTCQNGVGQGQENSPVVTAAFMKENGIQENPLP